MKNKSAKIPTNETPVCGVPSKVVPVIACAMLRIEKGKVQIAPEVFNKGVAAVEMEETGTILVTLAEQPSARPFVLCQDAFIIPGEEYKEFRISPAPTIQVGASLSFVAIYQ